MKMSMVNIQVAARVAALAVAGLILANCSGAPKPFDPGYRPAPGTSFTVTVRPGDTLSQIADRYRVSEEDIAAINGIVDPDHILSGDRLYVPAYGAGRTSVDNFLASRQNQPASYAPEYTVTEPDSSSSATFATSERFLWPVSGQVVSRFGMGVNGIRNDGINIIAEHGTPFRAAGAGTVSYVGNELRGFGNLLLIEHDNGFVTAYAHADRVTVVRGQRVEAGQFVGYLGSTGDVSEPQLHFEIRLGTRPVNPSALLVETQSNQASLTPSDPASS